MTTQWINISSKFSTTTKVNRDSGQHLRATFFNGIESEPHMQISNRATIIICLGRDLMAHSRI